MGQYYNIWMFDVIDAGGLNGIENLMNYAPKIDGEHQGRKLMEHSWFENKFVNRVASELYEKPKRIAWVGDYAEPEDVPRKSFEFKEEDIDKIHWLEKIREIIDGGHLEEDVTLKSNGFQLHGKMLVNRSKKLYLDLDCYYAESYKNNLEHGDGEDADWVIHPLPLLTAIGNGKGGGDYHGTYDSYVGQWAMDLIEIIEDDHVFELLDSGYKEIKLCFRD